MKAIIALFLMPTEARAVVKEPGEWRNELKTTLSKPVPTPASLAPLAPQALEPPPAPVEPAVAMSSE